MPYVEKGATATSVVVAGWNNPNNGYRLDSVYANTSTDAAEQAYTAYNIEVGGMEKIDKVYAQIKHYISIAKAAAGDSHEVTCTLRVYDGSTWQNYQITNLVYTNATPLTDEQPTVTVGDTNAQTSSIDLTSFLNTATKLANVQIRLLFAVVTAGAGCTATWYVDAVLITVSHSPSAGTTIIAEKPIPLRVQHGLDAVEKALETISQSP